VEGVMKITVRVPVAVVEIAKIVLEVVAVAIIGFVLIISFFLF
jgi:hypothetical protein